MAERGILEQAYGQLIPQGMRPNYAAPRTSVEPTPMVGRGEIRPYTFSWRDMAKQWLGSIGMSDNTANAVITLADFTPVGAAFVGNEARRAVTRGERLAPAAEVAMAAIPLPMAAKRAAAGKSIQLLEDWISKSKDQTFNGPNAIDAIKRRGFDAGFGKNYELKLVKTSDVKPSQFGEDYLNESSKYTASNILNAKSIKDISREADLLPITLDETLNVMDGNHRHAAAILNGDEYIPALVPVGEGYGKIINLDSFGDGKPAVRVADEGSGIFRVFVGDNNAGTISIAKSGQGDFVSAAYLEPQFTGKRYGMDAYNQIEQQIGRRLVPSPLGLSANARPFWRRRLAEMSEEERQDVFRRSYNAGIGYGVPDRDVRLRLYEVGGGNALDALDGVAPNLGGETPSVTVY